MSVMLKNKLVTVQKEHRCVWCGETINKGESARYQVYALQSRELSTQYIHPECQTACEQTHWDDMYDDELPDPYTHKRGEPIDWESY